MKNKVTNLTFNCAEKDHAFTQHGTKEFCSSCNEFVHDFTQLNKRELQEVLSQANAPICGKVFQDQLDLATPTSIKWVAAGITTLLSLTLNTSVSSQTTSPPAVEQTDHSEHFDQQMLQDQVAFGQEEVLAQTTTPQTKRYSRTHRLFRIGRTHVFVDNRFPFLHIRRWVMGHIKLRKRR